MEAFMGTILAFGFNFAPRGWALCNGQTIAISQNSALFALLGTIYGGNGQTTFQLPNLQSRLPIGMGQGGGLSPYVIGQVSGTESTNITINNMPSHNHSISVNNTAATVNVPTAGLAIADANGSDPSNGDAVTVNIYAPAAPNVALHAQTCGMIGGNQPISILQPTLAINYSIALEGIFPSRN